MVPGRSYLGGCWRHWTAAGGGHSAIRGAVLGLRRQFASADGCRHRPVPELSESLADSLRRARRHHHSHQHQLSPLTGHPPPGGPSVSAPADFRHHSAQGGRRALRAYTSHHVRFRCTAGRRSDLGCRRHRQLCLPRRLFGDSRSSHHGPSAVHRHGRHRPLPGHGPADDHHRRRLR